MRIEDVLTELQAGHDHHPGHQPGRSRPGAWRDRTCFLLNGDDRRGGPRPSVMFSDNPANRADLRLRQRDLRMSAPASDAYGIVTRRPEPLVRRVPGAASTCRSASARGMITSLIGPSGLRQDHAAALLQPHQRALRQRPDHRRDRDPRQEHLRPRRLADRAAQGASAWSSSAPTRCRSRSTRTWSSACGSTRRRADAQALRAGRRPSRRPSREVGLWDDLKDRLSARATDAAARAAAEALHRPAAAAQARGHPDGRAVLGARRRGAPGPIEELMFDPARSATRSSSSPTTWPRPAASATSASSCCMGEVVEHSPTAELFLNPRDPKTADYIEGRYG